MMDLVLRIFIAGVLGGLIGLEREYRGLFMVLSMYGFEEVRELSNMSVDPSRVASQIVTGIGFIGAGAIIFQKKIHGLTTAAGVWVTAAVGMTCGSSLYILAVATTVMVIICLEAEWFLIRKKKGKTDDVEVIDEEE